MDKLREIIDFNKPVVYLDIEAISYKNEHRFLQLSAIVVDGNKIVKQFNMCSNPGCPIHENVLNLLNKEEKFFLNKKTNIFLLNEFIKFSSEYDQFVCFGSYDQQIINYQYSTIKKKPIILIDVQKNFFNELLENNKLSLSLSLLAEALSINNTQINEHDALLDAKMLYSVIKYSLEIDKIDNLKKMIYSELIKPRERVYKKKASKIIKNNFLFSKNAEYVYFDLKINKKFLNNSDKKKYISNIDFIAKKYSSKGVLLKSFNKFISFQEDEQDIAEKNIDWIFKKFQNIFFDNSIIINNKNFNLFLKYYESKNKYLPLYYYISYENLSGYVFDILKRNKDAFINDDALMKKIISLIRPKWNKIINLKKGVK